MLASVIVSTYNRPEHLERCLESLRYQTTQDFEILIADDGSGPETRAVVERAVRELPVDVTHAFQEDRGFRKSAILNRAAQMARSDYLIYTDGDCLLRENFVETHIHYRRPGEFLVGRPVKLSRKRSEQIDFATIQKGRHARPALSDWWDMLWRRNRYLPYGVYLPGRVGFEIAQRLKKNKSPRGTNMSLWKSDLMRVNGWNEDFEGWGLEDVEFGYRLRLGGVVPKLVVYKAIAFHLWHAEEDKTSKRPRHAYTATKQRGLAWCPNGLVKAATPEDAGQIA